MLFIETCASLFVNLKKNIVILCEVEEKEKKKTHAQ